MKLNRLSVFLFISILSLVTAGCGGSGGSSDDSKSSSVRDMFTDDPAVKVGDDVDLDVLFSFAHQTVVDDNHNVIVIVRIPNGLAYEADTSRIDEIGGTDSVTPLVEACPNGDTYLHYDLGQNVLENATDPNGDADGRLKMAIAGAKALGTVVIAATAGYDFDTVLGSCAGGLVPQRTSNIVVTP